MCSPLLSVYVLMAFCLRASRRVRLGDVLLRRRALVLVFIVAIRGLRL